MPRPATPRISHHIGNTDRPASSARSPRGRSRIGSRVDHWTADPAGCGRKCRVTARRSVRISVTAKEIIAPPECCSFASAHANEVATLLVDISLGRTTESSGDRRVFDVLRYKTVQVEFIHTPELAQDWPDSQPVLGHVIFFISSARWRIWTVLVNFEALETVKCCYFIITVFLNSSVKFRR